ncbi:metal ABC transporter permease [Corynebacterium falsenii]|uniref:metal ABC transporter permease n=1 Tax=Corynebacterium falsenii TaxID=108486 RepID=UPI003FD46E94
MTDFSTGNWWADTMSLLGVDFVQNAILAALLLGVVSGAIAPLIVMRQMSFAAHSTGELALMGAAAALLFGASVSWGALVGAVLAAVVLTALGMREQDSIVAVVLSFGMGLSVLFIYLYPGRSSTAFSLLTGQIVGVSGTSLGILAGLAGLVVAVVALLWRPLLFATVDPVLAAASGVKVRVLGLVFAALIGVVASQGVQIVGALLLIALLITPGAAAVKVTSNPVVAVVLSGVFSVVSAVGGLVLSLAPGLPVSVFVTTISFVIYLLCRGVSWLRSRNVDADSVRAREYSPGASGGSSSPGALGASGAPGSPDSPDSLDSPGFPDSLGSSGSPDSLTSAPHHPR